MLVSVISNSLFNSISMIMVHSILPYGYVANVGLIILLSFKEVLMGSAYWNESLNKSLNVAIVPLYSIFIGIVIFKVIGFMGMLS